MKQQVLGAIWWMLFFWCPETVVYSICGHKMEGGVRGKWYPAVSGSEPSYNSIDSFDTAKIGLWKKRHLSGGDGLSGSTPPRCFPFPAWNSEDRCVTLPTMSQQLNCHNSQNWLSYFRMAYNLYLRKRQTWQQGAYSVVVRKRCPAFDESRLKSLEVCKSPGQPSQVKNSRSR